MSNDEVVSKILYTQRFTSSRSGRYQFIENTNSCRTPNLQPRTLLKQKFIIRTPQFPQRQRIVLLFRFGNSFLIRLLGPLRLVQIQI